MHSIGEDTQLRDDFQKRLHTFESLFSQHPNKQLQATIRKPFLAEGYSFPYLEISEQVANVIRAKKIT